MANSIDVPPRLLIVDDDPMILLRLDEIATDAGFDVLDASNGPDALEILNEIDAIAALVTDIDLGGQFEGLQLAEAVHYRWDTMRIVVMSGMADVDLEKLPTGAIFLRKPVSAEQLKQCLVSLES